MPGASVERVLMNVRGLASPTRQVLGGRAGANHSAPISAQLTPHLHAHC